MTLPSLSRRLVFLAAAGLFSAAAIAYAFQLGALTPFASPDEVLIGLMAHSIRTTGHDLNGRVFPLFFEVPPLSWYQPVAVYSEAALQLVRPFGITTLRTPSVVIGLINGLLLWRLLARATGSSWVALSGALILLSAPAHFIHSRLALDYIYPLPFILGWWYCLARFDQSRDRWWMAAGSAALCVGMFSYASAMILMPALLLLTIYLGWRTGGSHSLFAAAAPIALPAALLAAWLAWHPEMIGDSVSRYSVYDAQLTPLQGAREFLSYPNLARKLSLYWSYLNPAFLFMDAAAPPLSSVRGWGLMLPAAMPLFLAGIWQTRLLSPVMRTVLFCGVLVAAAPAVIVDEPDAAQRVLPLLPFLAAFSALGVQAIASWQPRSLSILRLLATAAAAAGVAYAIYVFATEGRLSGSLMPILAFAVIAMLAFRHPSRLGLGRAIAAVLLAVIAAQFVQFHRDYRADYPVRFRDLIAGDLGRALDVAIANAAPQAAPIYLNAYVDMIRQHWQFAATAAARTDLVAKAIYFEPQNLAIEAVPAGSLIVARSGDEVVHRAFESGNLELLEAVPEPSGRIVFTVYRRR